MEKMTSLGKLSPALGENPVDVSVAVPVYNEEANIEPFLRRIVPILERIGSYEILFCLDPSSDRTEETIEKHMGKNPNLGLLVMSRRFGQPAATMAGILNCRGDACVVIDVDLQDPPEVIPDMYAKLLDGYDVVYATRRPASSTDPPARAHVFFYGNRDIRFARRQPGGGPRGHWPFPGRETGAPGGPVSADRLETRLLDAAARGRAPCLCSALNIVRN